ncbi:arylsulfatase [Lewinella marina]|uniref:arylsulfatase n=1 Tax=Neolewinella marina TaxID=438751 RepID=UPI0016A120A9|nr:arylsulfatase [Neolewinella marina]NJB86829.1 arylsulfatase [Neolewinella marina]
MSLPEPAPPNLVVILADDLGYSDLGCYGGEIATPTLDRLAASGLKFRHFYNAARCCPTRASLLTGQYPHTAGMGKMVSDRDSEPSPGPYQGYLTDSIPTLAEVLRVQGYRTYMSGKWHVGERPEHWPLRRGFDRYFGLISGASSYYTIRRDQDRLRQMVLDSLPWVPPARGWYATDAYTDFALEVLADHDPDRPFFLYLSYTAPHWPLHAPEEIVEQYAGRYAAGWDSLRHERHARQQQLGLTDDRYVLPPLDDDVSDWSAADPALQWERRMEVYAAMVQRMDEGIGRLVRQLEATGQLDNTLILFLSDNGGSAEDISGRNLHRDTAAIGQPGSYVAYRKPWSQLSNVPFRKFKQWTDEGGIATPLIAHWPAGLPRHSDWIDAYAHVIDLLPTCVTAAGGDAGAMNLPGGDIFAVIDQQSHQQERPLFWEHYGRAAVRLGRYKLSREAADAPWRLFDLHTDPTELRDIAPDQPQRVEEMATLYAAWAVEVGV